jgi:MYXO-CTERM domain-containing protein
VIWKKKIGDQKIIGGVRTYSVRANSSRVLAQNPDGSIVRTDMLFVTSDDLRGNNTNNRKGGRYLQQNMGVAKATKAGLEWVIPMTDVTNQMLGIDATHLTFAAGLMEDNGKILPTMTILQGSQNGAAAAADFKVMALDLTAKKFVDYGVHAAGGTYDRHLYSNYLGGNPGNQGRNFAGATFVNTAKITGVTAASPKFLMLHALTGKDPSESAKPELKQTGYISVMPMRNPAALAPPPPGAPNTTTQASNGSGGGQNAQPQAGDPTPANEMPSAGTPSTPGNFSSGCSMASGSTDVSGLFFLLVGVGIVALARRRRA